MNKKLVTDKSLRYVYVESIKRDGAVNIYVYRKISLFFVKLFRLLNFSPNQVSILSLVFTLASAGFFLSTDKNLNVIGLIPFHIGKILDAADGQLAILTNKRTKLGGFIDPFVDRIGDIAVLGSLSLSELLLTGNNNIVYLFSILLIVLYINAFLDGYFESMRVRVSKVKPEAAIQFIPQRIRKNLRWDGGFSAIFISAFIILDIIPMMIALYCIVYSIPLVLTFRQIMQQLNTNRTS